MADTRDADAALRAETERLLRGFLDAGAVEVSAPILLPAETLLDLYGEDIRGRAYVTQDASRGEQMLRPDFTVPVVEQHMSGGAEPARYAYAGQVFRRQDQDPSRAHEYVQVGYELFAREAPEEADAEVFALFYRQLEGLGLTAITGDIGILPAAVAGLDTSPARRAALMRHVWRPHRFRALLDRFAGRTPVPETRQALLSQETTSTAPHIGLRSAREIQTRIDALRADAALPPISQGETDLLDALLGVRGCADASLARLEDIARDLPTIAPAVAGLGLRLAALDARGIAPDTLDFEASYGRTSMEYYGGFVFGFHGADPGQPPVATGGRYDALTARLGGGQAIPAVGGVLRPDLLMALRGART
ncbi:ATP phosphoribosyltransferase regulatory subunit [Pseudaestuariivita sp.]|uniref:ATP phosphoribosyltransferase regulatory subunit n=1 Tax=Pseudaestuariivita sp. TaxID=2211669 RepID=UPI0040587497